MNEAKFCEEKPYVTFDFGTKDHSRYLKINYEQTIDTENINELNDQTD